MTPLVRPHQESDLQPELAQEATLEQRILNAVQEVKGQVRDLQTILMGSGNGGETAFGRLPMVEAKLEKHEKRIVTLENDALQTNLYHRGAGILGNWAAGFIGLVIGGIITGIVLHFITGK